MAHGLGCLLGYWLIADYFDYDINYLGHHNYLSFGDSEFLPFWKKISYF